MLFNSLYTQRNNCWDCIFNGRCYIMVNSRLEKNKKQRKDIAKEENIKKTKNISFFVFKVFIVLFIIFGTIYVSCRYIGTSGLFVKEYSLDYDNLPSSFYGLKIIQISDINYNENTTDINKVKDLIKTVNKYNPDIIVFTGDLIYGNVTHEELNMLSKELNKLDAKLGIKLDNNHPEPYLLVSNEDEFIWPELDHEENNEFSYCLGGKSQLGILLNGDVVLCCLDHRGHTKLGNIYNNTLEEILNGEIFQNHLKMLENKEYYFELCKKCTFRNRFL